MSTIEMTEAQNAFDSLVHRAEAGEDIIITRNGEPAVKVSPARQIQKLPSASDRERAMAALARIDAMAKEANAGPFDWEEWKRYRDEGRK